MLYEKIQEELMIRGPTSLKMNSGMQGYDFFSSQALPVDKSVNFFNPKSLGDTFTNFNPPIPRPVKQESPSSFAFNPAQLDVA